MLLFMYVSIYIELVYSLKNFVTGRLTCMTLKMYNIKMYNIKTFSFIPFVTHDIGKNDPRCLVYMYSETSMVNCNSFLC